MQFEFHADSFTQQCFTDVIEMVREDKTIGRGTCSTVDEAMTDDELIEDFCNWLLGSLPKSMLKRYLAHQKGTEKTCRSIAKDVRSV